MKNIAEILIDLKAVKFSVDPPFVWTSGIKSPVYCDNRLMIAYPQERGIITEAFVRKLNDLNFQPEVIAGTSTAGIPWAAFLAEKLHLPMVYVRSKPKEHGAKNQVEGRIKPHSKVIIIEDLISTGGSSLATAEALEKECQAEVLGVLAIMTWEMPAADNAFKSKNLELFTLTGFSELIPLAANKKLISEDNVDRILKFREDPASWTNL